MALSSEQYALFASIFIVGRNGDMINLEDDRGPAET